MMEKQRISSPLFPALALAVFCALPLTGCASLTGDPSAAEIAELKQRLNEERRNATVGEIEVNRLRDELANAKAALRRAEEELSRRRSDDTLRAEAPVRPLRPVDQAELEEPEPAAPAIPPPVAAPAVQPPAVAPPRATPSTLAEQVGSSGASGASGAFGEDPQVLYDRGYTLFHQKSYDLAEASFRTFLARFPDSELADNALFWIGESHYAKGDYEAALAVFAETVSRFPQGNKVSDALLKAGRSLEQLGRVDEAASTYREVEERYPGSVAAAGARERLDALDKAPGKSRSQSG